MNSSNSIIFLYPSKVVGGAELLFIKIAKYLSNSGRDVYYVDYIDGFARKELLGSNVKFIDFDNDKPVTIDFEATIISAVFHLNDLNKFVNITNDKVKLFFWCIHPFNIFFLIKKIVRPSKRSFKLGHYYARIFRRKQLAKMQILLRGLISLKSLYFMDYMNLYANEYMFDLKIPKKDYLQVIFDKNHIPNNSPDLINNFINAAWIGRLDVDKISALENVLDELLTAYPEKEINFHIISSQNLFDKSHTAQKKYKNINIIHSGVLLNEDLHEYLRSNVDILFAMGTSTFEGARQKIPTILLDFSYKKIDTKKYKWLYETKDYCVGFIYPTCAELNTHTMRDVVDQVFKNKQNIGNLCNKYVIDNFLIEDVVQKLEAYISTNELTWKEFKSLTGN